MEPQANNMSTYSGTKSPIETKVCSKCGRALPLSNFNRCTSNKDGLQRWCKDCQNEASRNRQKAKEKTASRQTASINPMDATPNSPSSSQFNSSMNCVREGTEAPSLTPTKSPSNVTTMEKSEYCETQSRISQAAAQERSVSQERAFERGAQCAIERATEWLRSHLTEHYAEEVFAHKFGRPIKGHIVFYEGVIYKLLNDFQKAMNQ